MPTSVLLVRWSGGWREVVSSASVTAYGRREAMIGLGAAQSPGEVDRVAFAQLEIYGNVREAIAADLAPVDDTDTPYLAFRVGDRVTVPDRTGTPVVERVIAMSVSEDDDGVITYAPELKDIVLEEQERQQQAIDKMVAGTMAGTSKVATPAAYIATTPADCCPPTPPPEVIES